jgi:hypothetical protein
MFMCSVGPPNKKIKKQRLFSSLQVFGKDKKIRGCALAAIQHFNLRYPLAVISAWPPTAAAAAAARACTTRMMPWISSIDLLVNKHAINMAPTILSLALLLLYHELSRYE